MTNVKLTFAAPPEHTLVIDGEELKGGEEFSVSQERAIQIITSREVPVANGAEVLAKLSGEKLGETARDIGLDPEGFENKAELAEALTQGAPDHTPSGGPEPVHVAEAAAEASERAAEVADHTNPEED